MKLKRNMKLKDRIKTYNFWVGIASALFLILQLIGNQFNFSIDENFYNNLFTTFCSILVLLGIIEVFGKAYISSQMADAIVFAVLIIVLLVKPTGILGKNIQEKV